MKAFYTSTSKQVLDIHEEARRIASHQTGAHPDTGVSTGVGSAAPPLDPAVSGKPLVGGASELNPKTTEAPTVV